MSSSSKLVSQLQCYLAGMNLLRYISSRSKEKRGMIEIEGSVSLISSHNLRSVNNYTLPIRDYSYVYM